MPLPTILSGNVASATAGAFEVANSCRFNDGDSPRCQKDLADGHDTAATISLWFKRCTDSAAQTLFECYEDSSNYFRVRLEASNEIQIRDRQGGSDQLRLKTSALIRDPSAWYSLIIVIDTTDGTAADRCKVYINGTRVTAFGTETTYGSSDTIETGNADSTVNVGGSGASDNYLDGYLAEVVFLDGVSQASSGFGEFDADSPTIFKPIDVSGLTFGTNGFYLDFEDSANLGNDANGGTDLTEANLAAVDSSTDTPTNNFCTLNPLAIAVNQPTFSQGNCQSVAGGDWYPNRGTFGVTAGKWFWEVKVTTSGGNFHGVAGEQVNHYDDGGRTFAEVGHTAYTKDGGGEMQYGADETTANYGSTDPNDITGIALNMDDKEISIYDNGSIIVTDFALDDAAATTTVFPAAAEWNATVQYNFGGCSAFTVSSANQDANGYGNFEYAVPSGYYALCTKNLAEFGG